MKRQYFSLFILLLTCSSAISQSTAGITGRPDTSYSSPGAYRSTLKDYPDISLVPELHSPLVAEKRNIVYCTIGARNLVIDAFYPKKKKTNAPAILIIHGGGWRSGNRTQHYPLAQHLAERGYACFAVEYRLSTEALYPAAVHDLKAAIRWIRMNGTRYGANTSKIAVLGFSAGGELAAFMGTTNGDEAFEGKECNTGVPSKVQAIVDIDGTLSFVHPESGEGDDSRSTSAATYWFGYPKKDNYALWEDASPLKHAGKSTPPTLFLNSSVDRMHAGRTDYIEALKKYNTYTEVHSFPGAPHSFCLFNPWFNPTVNYIDAFLKKVF